MSYSASDYMDDVTGALVQCGALADGEADGPEAAGAAAVEAINRIAAALRALIEREADGMLTRAEWEAGRRALGDFSGGDDEVAEWCGLHYRLHFPSLTDDLKRDMRKRFAESARGFDEDSTSARAEARDPASDLESRDDGCTSMDGRHLWITEGRGDGATRCATCGAVQAPPSRAHVVAIGNPFDGLALVGPFESGDAAAEWAEANHDAPDWWVLDLTAPERST